MTTKTPVASAAFSRLHASDTDTDRVLQDIYDKLAQLQSPLVQLHSQIKQLQSTPIPTPQKTPAINSGLSTPIPPIPGSPSGFPNPMTTLGDTISEDATPTPVRVAGNTSAQRNFFRQTGTGSASALPAWDTIQTGDLIGTVAINGSAGIPTGAGNQTVYISGGFTNPLVGRVYIGDGTGWHLCFSSRSGSVDTDLITFNDNGNVTFTQTIDATAYKVGGVAGATGSDSAGSIFSKGICTTVGSATHVQANSNPWIGTPTTARAFNTVYQNTSTVKSLTVTVSLAFPIAGGLVAILSDSGATPAFVLGQLSNFTNVLMATFVVLPGNYYNVTTSGGGGAVLVTWTEQQ